MKEFIDLSLLVSLKLSALFEGRTIHILERQRSFPPFYVVFWGICEASP